MWGNGSYEPRNFEAGMLVVGEAGPTRQSCFAMGIRGLGRHVLGKKEEPRGAGEEMWVLTSCDVSSLVIDWLCDQAGRWNAMLACFYFDFAAQKEQSPTSMLGALLKQLVSGLDKVPAEIFLAYHDQMIAIGGREPQLADIMRMLRIVTSRKPTFICIDAIDECVAGYRVKLLNSLDQILQWSPSTRIFVTGRPHIEDEVTKSLSGRVTSIRVTPRRHDIISFINSRLDGDTIPDAMDSTLKVDILKKVPEDFSEM